MALTTNVEHYEAALKEVYEPKFRDLYKMNKVLLEKLESSSDYVDMSGRYHVVPLGLAPNQSFGVLAEYGVAPTPTHTRVTTAKYGSVQHIAQVRISDRAILASSSPEAAVKNILTLGIDAVLEGHRQDLNRQCFGDGSGNLTDCAATNASTTVNVDDVTYLDLDMYIDIVDTTDGSLLAEQRKIIAVDEDNSTITIDGAAVTTTTDHCIVRHQAYGAEMNGLALIVAESGALGEVDPATPGYGRWKAKRDTTGGQVSLEIINKPIQYVEARGGQVRLMIAGQTTYNAMATYLEQLRQIPAVSPPKLQGGMTGLSWQGKDVFMDLDCPATTLYMLDTQALSFGEIGEAGWLSERGPGKDEERILVHIPQTTYHQGLWKRDMQLLCFHRNRQAAIDNLIYTAA